MTITTFYDDVRDAIGRGTTNDARFDGWAQEAISQLETEHTFTWMKRTLEIPLVPGVDGNRVDLDIASIKAFNWAKFGLRQGAGSGQYTTFGRTLRIVDPVQIASIDLGYAGAAYRDGSTLVLDAQPQEASTLFASAWVYTQWTDDFDAGDTPPVLVRHYAGFKAYFMMVAAANLRSPDLGTIWTSRSDRGIQAMIAADTDSEWRERRNMRVGQDLRDA